MEQQTTQPNLQTNQEPRPNSLEENPIEEKKPWFKNKKLITIVSILIGIFVVAGLSIAGYYYKNKILETTQNSVQSIPKPISKQDPLNILPDEIPQFPSLIYDGQIIGKQYDYVSDPFELNGKLGYQAYQDGKHFIVYNGIEGKKYDMIWRQGLEELVYIAEKKSFLGSKKYVVVFDNKESEEYERIIHAVKIIENKPTFIIQEHNKFYLIFGENKIELENADYFFTELNDKLAYGKIRSNGNDHVFYEGVKYESNTNIYQEYRSKYDEIVESNYNKNKRLYGSQIKASGKIMYSDMKEVNGRLAYVVQKGDNKYVLVYDGKESKEYYRINIGSVEIINGKLTYVAKKKAQTSIVVYGDEESEVYWDVISPIFYINGQLVYFIDYKNHDHALVVDGEKYDFDGYLCSLVEINDKLAYTITKKDCWLAY